jgi:hypothetical protein
MRFRSVRVQRLPLFDQVIAIFEKELETIDIFRSLFPIGDVLKDENHLMLGMSLLRNRRLAAKDILLDLARRCFWQLGLSATLKR